MTTYYLKTGVIVHGTTSRTQPAFNILYPLDNAGSAPRIKVLVELVPVKMAAKAALPAHFTRITAGRVEAGRGRVLRRAAVRKTPRIRPCTAVMSWLRYAAATGVSLGADLKHEIADMSMANTPQTKQVVATRPAVGQNGYIGSTAHGYGSGFRLWEACNREDPYCTVFFPRQDLYRNAATTAYRYRYEAAVVRRLGQRHPPRARRLLRESVLALTPFGDRTNRDD
ncbi:hypothetical protein MAPG_11520 [Magnaporthiopsis poae ATCC 64411]|uniref:Uncharacterized protein n=1 Tax=Magnaporthiopsis poae (strain ATCC 64411 / 73-15) TaxID=644358 RepID=A0A0C4EFH2_MAGP6|nr:hypothetical protein MAPG_11520 [Magnaporthiopsis poae ATCC 64411]